MHTGVEQALRPAPHLCCAFTRPVSMLLLPFLDVLGSFGTRAVASRALRAAMSALLVPLCVGLSTAHPAAAQSATPDAPVAIAARDAGPRPDPHPSGRPVGARPVALRPGDLVRLYVWREPELSRDYEVDGVGQVALPKLGPLPVAGLSPDSLKQLLEGRYKRFIRDPSIEVTMRRRITVLGAVRNPGVLQVDPYVTVAEALALAGGTTPEGRTDYVRVRRGDRTLPTRVSTQTPIADSPVESGDQLYVPDRGWANRNVTLVSAALSAVGMLVFVLR